MPEKPAVGVKVIAPVVVFTLVVPFGEATVTFTLAGFSEPSESESLANTFTVIAVLNGVETDSFTALGGLFVLPEQTIAADQPAAGEDSSL